ncbi:bifunctional [glutamine synthetase] adenylyltransferase/[glutamine synthetase]-adenylyl-L-tyrosine phosphorylase [Actibacterium pelagium]|uniref:Glutamate-ammonia-ligase adenylyltransferase n=1 Tax=Actibacterium pelagium TaxID=2029103 RepID=A0A917EGS7_9RHOB|nr:bifunctional [glutamine synthetase] adenylyltransferase/[glutamine synthetase]-adenylyl-L-tyrosine phosphorylase [Actibacterium pelagium]GGE41692.1 glutamate-ammonia-ligase adenylyltransferase [Actibacterium pelagium]
MEFARRLTRAPIPFDPDIGAEVAQSFAGLGPEMQELLNGTAGCSPFLGGLLKRDMAWAQDALCQSPEAAFEQILKDIDALDYAGLKPGLRTAKRHAALLIALADLGGVWSLEEVTDALTRLAQSATHKALGLLVAEQVRRKKLPSICGERLDQGGGMVAIAMGKMGAYELNYSSDIDLICLFDETQFDPDDYYEVRSGFIRATRELAGVLSDQTGDGYVFRTDLRLRPDASVTPVCISMEVAERYYESLGRTWERAAHIKARACAGDIKAGEGYLDRLTSFVWRKHLDFAAIQDAHDMRLRIRDHKGLHGPITVENHNIKLGAGGIREIEFFTQTRQLIAGGRDLSLRVRGTVEGLDRLATNGWIPQAVSEQLSEDYRIHRELEHRLQMVGDAQTQTMPKSAEGVDRIARFMGYGDTQAFRDELTERLERVADLTEDFFEPSQPGQNALIDIPEATAKVVERWQSYPALRSERAVEIFNRLRPGILKKLADSDRPEEALTAFDGFLSGLPAGVQLFSLFEANPQLIDLIIDITSIAPELSQYLSRNASVLDAVIGGDFFAPWPGLEPLVQELSAAMGRADDYERKLDTARRWLKEWHFRIGVHLLRGLVSAEEASSEYADLAEAILAALWPVVVDNFAKKHGPPPGNGAVVLGMGSLGAGRLTPRSDLDLIVIYDPAGVDSSEGRRPLASRTYYARLTQALVTAMSAPMSEGKLYEVDMRLRPSGNQGPVATSLESFRLYQREEAWTWEHLALTRARVVAGSPDLAQVVEAFRRLLLAEKGNPEHVLEGVRDMRTRLADAKPGTGVWDAKNGPGNLTDIELVASAGALLAASTQVRPTEQLEDAVAGGWPSAEQAEILNRAHTLLRKLQIASKLLSDSEITPDKLGQGSLRFVLQTCEVDDLDKLSKTLNSVTAEAGATITQALGDPSK